MQSDLSVESLSEAFGFSISKEFVRAIEAAVARSPQEPSEGFEKFGLTLGGPLYCALGGSAQSLRCAQMPPEFFPFAVRRCQPNVYVGFFCDSPCLDSEPCTLFGVFVPESRERTGIVARDEQELFRWLGAHLEEPDSLGTVGKSKSYDPLEVQSWREQKLIYRTADGMGVVAPEEPAPLALLHEELRSRLIEKREHSKIREAGMEALSVGAPGAALALARDLSWWLGHRDNWAELATELYEGAYTQLERPLLTRVARREWARFFGGS